MKDYFYFYLQEFVISTTLFKDTWKIHVKYFMEYVFYSVCGIVIVFLCFSYYNKQKITFVYEVKIVTNEIFLTCLPLVSLNIFHIVYKKSLNITLNLNS